MKGKALFFKTIGVQEEMKRSMFRRVRPQQVERKRAEERKRIEKEKTFHAITT